MIEPSLVFPGCRAGGGFQYQRWLQQRRPEAVGVVGMHPVRARSKACPVRVQASLGQLRDAKPGASLTLRQRKGAHAGSAAGLDVRGCMGAAGTTVVTRPVVTS